MCVMFVVAHTLLEKSIRHNWRAIFHMCFFGISFGFDISADQVNRNIFKSFWIDIQCFSNCRL